MGCVGDAVDLAAEGCQNPDGQAGGVCRQIGWPCSVVNVRRRPGDGLGLRAGHGVIATAWYCALGMWIGLPGVLVAVLIGVTSDLVVT